MKESASPGSAVHELEMEDGITRFVAGVLGPTNRTVSLSPDVEDPGYRNISFDILVQSYQEAATGLIEGGADLILVETVFILSTARRHFMQLIRY